MVSDGCLEGWLVACEIISGLYKSSLRIKKINIEPRTNIEEVVQPFDERFLKRANHESMPLTSFKDTYISAHELHQMRSIVRRIPIYCCLKTSRSAIED